MNRAVRLSWPDVEPLQVWDLDIGDGKRFWEVVDERRIVAWRAQGHSERAIAIRLVDGIITACYSIGRKFEGVYVLGGLTRLPHLKEFLWQASTPWPFFVPPVGRDYAWRAKLHMFGSKQMIVVDVGQTAIKGFLPDGEPVMFKRDTQLIPYGDCLGKAARSIQFIRSAIASLRSAAPKASVLLGLPAPVDKDLVPGYSTYGFEGCKTFVRDVVPDPACPVFVMNDAELAAECARAESGTDAPLLVLTLGHGPGAAILRRAP